MDLTPLRYYSLKLQAARSPLSCTENTSPRRKTRIDSAAALCYIPVSRSFAHPKRKFYANFYALAETNSDNYAQTCCPWRNAAYVTTALSPTIRQWHSPISPGAREHLVDPQHVEGVHPHAQVEGVLSCRLGHVLVACNAGSLEGLGGHVLLLPGDQMHAVGELIHPLPLHADIVDADLRVGDTAAVAGLGIRLVLDLPVAVSEETNRADQSTTWKRKQENYGL